MQNLCNTTSNRQIFDRNRYEIARGNYGKFSNFGSEIQIRVGNIIFDIKIQESTSKIQNRCSKIQSLIPFESRFETSKFEISAPDLVGIYILEFFFDQNLEFVLGKEVPPRQ